MLLTRSLQLTVDAKNLIKTLSTVGELFTFGYQIQDPSLPYVTYRVISKDGVMGDPVPITPSGPVMMHDFAITEKYAIFMDHPLYFMPKVWSPIYSLPLG